MTSKRVEQIAGQISCQAGGGENTYLNSLFGLQGKTVLITGGTRGIGKGLVEALASAGAHIILLVRNLSSPQTLSIRTAVQTLGRICHLYECDLTDRKAVAEVVPRICERDGRSVDVLVNCGGVQHRAPAVDFPDEMWDQIIQVNLSSAFVLSRALARHWFSLSPSTNPATSTKKIINIASVLTFTGSAQIPAYVATKGAIGQLTKALSNEWMSKGICVNAIAPGYIATELTEGIRGDVEKERHVLERVPANRWGTPEDLAGAVIYLSSKASDFVSGEIHVVDGGFCGR